MKMLVIDNYKSYLAAIKANKRKSKTFYYRYIGHSGVVFTKRIKDAHLRPSKEDAEFLIMYLQKRIEEVGFVLKEF